MEKNFDLKPGDKKRLIQGAELQSKKSFTDVYYDNDSCGLTSRDYWLRKRDDRFELKVPLNAKGVDREATDQYHELETDAEIAAALGIAAKAASAATADLTAALAAAGYEPFATIVTKREHYRKGDFNLDFDEVEELHYATFEPELMVATPEEIPAAEARILAFAKEHGISGSAGHGKVIEYILRNHPAHYEVLKASGVVMD